MYEPIRRDNRLPVPFPADMIWDAIVVGGGLAGSVISNRLAGYRPELKILVVEAGPNANDRQDIVWPNSTNTIGGDFDWKLASVPQVHVDNRSITLAQGKALGGGTVINMGTTLLLQGIFKPY